MAAPDLIPIERAVAETGLSRRTIQRLIADGRLKRFRKLGDRRTYVDIARLRRLMAIRETE